MTEKKQGRARKVAAGTLLGLGVLGIGMAAASQLEMNWNGNFQAGAVAVDADCQTSEIEVSYNDPDFAGSAGVPWTIDQVNFDSIDAKCDGGKYEVAYKTDDNWIELDKGTASAGVLSVDVPGVDTQTITGFALTIYSE